MGMKKSFYIVIISLLISISLDAQIERGNQWVMGGFSNGEGLIMDFNSQNILVSYGQTGIKMEGSNTSMCDTEGNLLFYSNGCLIVNAIGEIMENGDSINPGFLDDHYCPYGGSPIIQGVVAIPSPENEDHYYVFNLDFDYAFPPEDTSQLQVAPLRVYYQEIDMTQNDGLGAVVAKNQIAVQDTFSRVNLQAVRHANNRDWWIVMPKSHSNCYFLTLITPDGIQPALLKCAGTEWTSDDSGGQAVFSPDLKKYIRFNEWNGLNIFDFDNAAGDLSNEIRIMFPNDTIGYFAGVAVSPNSRFLYACAKKRVYQFDLEAIDIEASKVLVAEWDGTFNPYPTIFYLAALAPDGRIYISSTSSHLSLHVIENPDSLGLACDLVQNGVELPAYNFATIPNIPHYCSSDEDCIVVTNETKIREDNSLINIYPNPTRGEIWIELSEANETKYELRIYDLLGTQVISKKVIDSSPKVDISTLQNGSYIYVIEPGKKIQRGRIFNIE